MSVVIALVVVFAVFFVIPLYAFFVAQAIQPSEWQGSGQERWSSLSWAFFVFPLGIGFFLAVYFLVRVRPRIARTEPSFAPGARVRLRQRETEGRSGTLVRRAGFPFVLPPTVWWVELDGDPTATRHSEAGFMPDDAAVPDGPSTEPN